MQKPVIAEISAIAATRPARIQPARSWPASTRASASGEEHGRERPGRSAPARRAPGRPAGGAMRRNSHATGDQRGPSSDSSTSASATASAAGWPKTAASRAEHPGDRLGEAGLQRVDGGQRRHSRQDSGVSVSPGSTRPLSYASTTAPTRSRTPSLPSTRPTCVFTVASLRCRRAAISRVRQARGRSGPPPRPRARSAPRTARRAVSPGGGRRTKRSTSRRVTAGASSASPAATVRTASARRAGDASLSRKPAGAGAERLVHVLVQVEGGQHQDRRRQPVLREAPGGLDAVDDRHPDVHDAPRRGAPAGPARPPRRRRRPPPPPRCPPRRPASRRGRRG